MVKQSSEPLPVEITRDYISLELDGAAMQILDKKQSSSSNLFAMHLNTRCKYDEYDVEWQIDYGSPKIIVTFQQLMR